MEGWRNCAGQETLGIEKQCWWRSQFWFDCAKSLQTYRHVLGVRFFSHCGVETPLKAPFLHFQIPVKDWRCLCGINLARWTRMRGYLAAASKEVSRIESNTNFETTFCCKGNGHSNQAVIFFDLWCPWFFFMRWFQEIASKSDRGITPPLSGMQRNMWGIPAGRGPVVTSL